MKTAESVCARGGTVWKAAAGIRTSEGEEYERQNRNAGAWTHERANTPRRPPRHSAAPATGLPGLRAVNKGSVNGRSKRQHRNG